MVVTCVRSVVYCSVMDVICEMRKLSFSASVITAGSTAEPGMSADAPLEFDTKLIRRCLCGDFRGEYKSNRDWGRDLRE
jgi:hypothetical protein